MEREALPDPFGIHADPRLYVPRRATEEALDRLERGVATSPSGALRFTGPPGIGKTLLLHVLAAELRESHRTVYLPYPKLPPGGLWMYVAKELGLGARLESRRDLERLLGEAPGDRRALLLQVDDASSLPAETLDDLLALARSEPRVRVLLAYAEGDAPVSRVPEDVPVVRFDEPMSRSETQAYVKTRLVACRASPALRDAFDAATVARLHRESEGSPLRLHGLAVEVVRRAEEGARGATLADLARSVAGVARPEARAASGGTPVRGAPDRAPAALPPLRAQAAPLPTLRPPRAGRVMSRRRRRRARRRRRLAVAAFFLGVAVGLLPGNWHAIRDRALEAGALGSGGETPAPAPPHVASLPRETTPMPAPVDTPSRETRAPALRPAPPPSPAVPEAAISGAPIPPETQAEPPQGAEGAPEAPAVGATTPPQEAPAEAVRAAPVPEVPGRSPEAAAPPGDEPAQVAAPVPPPERKEERDAVAAPRSSDRIEPQLPPITEKAPAPAPETPLALGRLRIEAEPDVAIEIDGRPYGRPPLRGIRLPRGEHRVIARYRDGATALKTIRLGDEDVSITFH
jgi:hypothetical protein